MLKVALTFENTPDDLVAAAALIEILRGRETAAVPVNSVASASPAPPPMSPTDWKVTAWFQRLGEGSRKFWKAAALYARTHANFTFDDLAAASGLTKGALRSYQRNSYRAIRAENAPDPLGQAEWDAHRQCNVYRVSDVVRDELIRLTETITT